MTRRKTLRLAVTVLFAILALIASRTLKTRPAVDTTAPAGSSSPVGTEWRQVIRVVDGDTILLDRNERVRLIGVDTPETADPRRPVERFGKQASEFTRRTLAGRSVRLEYDQTRKDQYGRTLAYVYRDDGIFLNAEIIKQGYGIAYTRFPFRYIEDFRLYERQARDAGKGLWSSSD